MCGFLTLAIKIYLKEKYPETALDYTKSPDIRKFLTPVLYISHHWDSACTNYDWKQGFIILYFRKTVYHIMSLLKYLPIQIFVQQIPPRFLNGGRNAC